MTNPRFSLLAGGLLLMGMGFGLASCGSEPPPPPQPVVYTPPEPEEPPPPPVTSIQDLMTQLRIDKRVVMHEQFAPATDAERKAVLEFFDAFVRGDSRALSRKLSRADAAELAVMVESGQWERVTSKITRVEVQAGRSPVGDCALGLFDVDGVYQAQLWYYTNRDSDFMFDAAATPPNIINKLSGTDWIKSWHDILDEERELAGRPDSYVRMPQRNLDEGSERSEGGGSGPAPTGPMAPATPGPDNTPPPRRPPGIPGPGSPGN